MCVYVCMYVYNIIKYNKQMNISMGLASKVLIYFL